MPRCAACWPWASNTWIWLRVRSIPRPVGPRLDQLSAAGQEHTQRQARAVARRDVHGVQRRGLRPGVHAGFIEQALARRSWRRRPHPIRGRRRQALLDAHAQTPDQTRRWPHNLAGFTRPDGERRLAIPVAAADRTRLRARGFAAAGSGAVEGTPLPSGALRPSGTPPGPPTPVAADIDRCGAVPTAPSAFGTNGSGVSTSVVVLHYDTGTGRYVAPDGQLYRQSDLVRAKVPKSWKDMIISSD